MLALWAATEGLWRGTVGQLAADFAEGRQGTGSVRPEWNLSLPAESGTLGIPSMRSEEQIHSAYFKCRLVPATAASDTEDGS